MAVLIGVISFDGNLIRCKGHTAARSYMKSKQVKYGIRLYTSVDWKSGYLLISPTTVLQKKRNLLGRPVSHRISTTPGRFRDKDGFQCCFRGLCFRSFGAANGALHAGSAQAKGRLVVTDDFYRRYNLGEQLRRLTDNEISFLGTVRLNNLDGQNRRNIKEAKALLKAAERGKWNLRQAYHSVVRSSRGASTQNITVAEDTGFVVWKDRNIEFYCNSLADSPQAPISESNEHAVQCVHGLVQKRRWVGDEELLATIVNVPAVVMTYNLFLNGVDRFDQLRASHVTARRERQLPISIFTFLLDASVQNGYELSKSMKESQTDTRTLKDFKRRVVEAIMASFFSLQAQRKLLVSVTRSIDLARCGSPQCESDTEEEGGAENKGKSHSDPDQTTKKIPHMVLQMMGDVCVRCYLCKVRNVSKSKLWARYACRSCSLVFHVECYAAYHYGLKTKRHNIRVHADIRHITQRTRMVTSRRRLRCRLTSCAVPISEFVLPISRDRPQTPVSSTHSIPLETHRKRRRVKRGVCNTGEMCRGSETHNMRSATHDDGVAEVADNRAPGEDDESIENLLSHESSKSWFMSIIGLGQLRFVGRFFAIRWWQRHTYTWRCKLHCFLSLRCTLYTLFVGYKNFLPTVTETTALPIRHHIGDEHFCVLSSFVHLADVQHSGMQRRNDCRLYILLCSPRRVHDVSNSRKPVQHAPTSASCPPKAFPGDEFPLAAPADPPPHHHLPDFRGFDFVD